MYYLNMGEYTVVGSSPEILVRLEDKKVTVRPIAGTRPRSDDINTDKKYEVKINLSFSLDSGIVNLSRERKPYLKIVKNK